MASPDAISMNSVDPLLLVREDIKGLTYHGVESVATVAKEVGLPVEVCNVSLTASIRLAIEYNLYLEDITTESTSLPFIAVLKLLWSQRSCSCSLMAFFSSCIFSWGTLIIRR